MNVYVNDKLRKTIGPTQKSMEGKLFRDTINKIKIGDKVKFVLMEGYFFPKETKVLSEIIITSEHFRGYINTQTGKSVLAMGMGYNGRRP
ncbi:hypothetical protein KPL39_14965 [Clostridium gasigenes]|uniref:hypothetical protein n=1 Tax=Clostridium gasigenes TaxID=94869 RepID=UPI001C0B224C|nr:hypothetical protein [Clostridium gasigenes]MBU3137564.1 hypothetical protein [Clostridium gasigenes]